MIATKKNILKNISIRLKIGVAVGCTLGHSRGRERRGIKVAVSRCFVLSNGAPITTGQVLRRSYPRYSALRPHVTWLRVELKEAAAFVEGEAQKVKASAEGAILPILNLRALTKGGKCDCRVALNP